jgi:predicted GIY-YIG superfamily endonuclease
MLATWIRDVYAYEDRAEMRAAIDDIASPLDSYGFASAGVYVFFDPAKFEALYIGLARDLSQRFAQHNGLAGLLISGCKRVQLEKWFTQHKSLGYAIFVQSHIGQVAVSRQVGTMSAEYYDEENDAFWGYGESGLETIKANEGVLIAAFLRRHGRLPRWNKIGGAVRSRERATDGIYAQLDLATGQIDSLLLARRTIRELSGDPTAMSYEEALDVGRLHSILKTFGAGVDSLTILKSLEEEANNQRHINPELLEVGNRMYASKYYSLPPPIPASQDTEGSIPYLMKWRADNEK